MGHQLAIYFQLLYNHFHEQSGGGHQSKAWGPNTHSIAFPRVLRMGNKGKRLQVNILT